MKKLPYLNLGCGSTYHAAFTNIDFVSATTDVIAYNLLKGIPFPDNNFEVVYHSHVLEHIPKDKALFFMKECFRVLKSGGLIRVAIPNLEQLAINYLNYLNDALNNISKADEKYEWTMLELYDQVVRTQTGGAMIDYIRDTSKKNDEFLLERNGKEAELLIKHIRNPNRPLSLKYTLLSRIKNKLKQLFDQIHSEEYKIGKFRLGGEVHQWMYDRYSLGKLLKDAGFSDVQTKSAFESAIHNWNNFELDGKAGMVRKPDSLFMEAKK